MTLNLLEIDFLWCLSIGAQNPWKIVLN